MLSFGSTLSSIVRHTHLKGLFKGQENFRHVEEKRQETNLELEMFTLFKNVYV